jgi:hypothetical protein
VVDAKPVIQTMTAASPLSSASVGTQGDSGIEDAGGARRVASKQTNKGKRSKSNLNRPRKDVDGALVEKRAKRRNYMQKRRHHQREEISEMEDKVRKEMWARVNGVALWFSVCSPMLTLVATWPLACPVGHTIRTDQQQACPWRGSASERGRRAAAAA